MAAVTELAFPETVNDGDTVVLTRTVLQPKHDKRLRLPQMNHRAISSLPEGTRFRVQSYTEATEEMGDGLKIDRRRFSFTGERGSKFQFTTFEVQRTTVTHDETISTKYHVANDAPFVREVLAALVSTEDPIKALIASAPDAGWEVVRALVGMYGISPKAIANVVQELKDRGES